MSISLPVFKGRASVKGRLSTSEIQKVTSILSDHIDRLKEGRVLADEEKDISDILSEINLLTRIRIKINRMQIKDELKGDKDE
jgi:hypothetical protein